MFNFSLHPVHPFLQPYISQKGKVKVKDLEEKFHVSDRWLQKQFLAQVGISPKEYARVVRFNALLDNVLTTTYKTPAVSLNVLLEEYGYYDQSHLNRDFKDFTGQTPLAFLTSKPNSISNVFVKQLE